MNFSMYSGTAFLVISIAAANFIANTVTVIFTLLIQEFDCNQVAIISQNFRSIPLSYKIQRVIAI